MFWLTVPPMLKSTPYTQLYDVGLTETQTFVPNTSKRPKLHVFCIFSSNQPEMTEIVIFQQFYSKLQENHSKLHFLTIDGLKMSFFLFFSTFDHRWSRLIQNSPKLAGN